MRVENRKVGEGREVRDKKVDIAEGKNQIPESSPCRPFSNQIHSDYFLITCTILLLVEVMRRS